MKRIFFIAIFSIITLMSSAQIKTVKGKIVERANGSPIAYTNIGIEGTFYGTASNSEGEFELKIPEEFKSENMYFSAVGFENKMIPVTSLKDNEFIVIKLDEQTYGIEGIDVAAQSKVLFRIIKAASERVNDNYLQGPISLKLYYSEIQNGRKREAVAVMNDRDGYSSPSILNAFKNRNYKFIQAKKDFETYSFRDGSTQLDEMLEADVVRMSNTILNPQLLNDYDLNLEKSTIFNGDSVWVIAYKTKKYDLPHTGDFYAISYNGKIYISKTDYGIIRNELHIESAKQNPQGRSLAIKSGGFKDVDNTIVTGYRKIDEKYVLSFVDCKKQFSTEKNQKIARNVRIDVLDVSDVMKEKIAGRDYFEETEFNAEFWQKFVKPN